MPCNFFFVSAAALCKSNEYYGMFRLWTALFKTCYTQNSVVAVLAHVSGFLIRRSGVQAPVPQSATEQGL